MVAAEGRWAWWNQYAPLPIETCVARAVAAKDVVHGVIVKAGYYRVAALPFIEAGIPVAADSYVKPDHPLAWGSHLGTAARDWGAKFAVINAEHEWESLSAGEARAAMVLLVMAVRDAGFQGELYASVDTRGTRVTLPYQRVLLEETVGFMPMVYPKAFRPSMPDGAVSLAFEDCLDGIVFRVKPVLPTIQTYGGIGEAAVREQLAEVERRRLPGCQAYTIGHATDAEWAAFVPAWTGEEEETMLPLAVLREEGDWLNRAWVTDGFRRYWYKSPAGLKVLEERGVLPRTVVVPPGTLDAIKVVDA